jgi:magnesium-transporting ATPase (P-type)
MNLLILNGSDPQTCEKELDQIISEMEQSLGKSTYAMVVDGKILSHVFAGDKKSKEKFLKVGKQCKTVICSRVTPLQKALVVRLVRSSLKKSITLSIGDGANDVSMIQEAHVGVGIMGREGNQAVRAADFAFGEFRFLQRLLTVHGRYNSLRLSNMILYCFYKNFVFITIQWFFGFVNGWSGQLVYEEIFFVAYNVIFTSIPPMIYGLFEKDVPEILLEKYPQLYREVKDGLFWNLEVILGWFFSAIYHSCIIFLIVYYVNFEGAVDVDGRSTGYWVQCYFLSTPLLLVVLGKIVITSRYWTWLPVAGILSSLGINAAVMFALVLLDWYSYADFGTAELLHSIPAFYLFCTLLPCVCLLVDLLIAQ